MEGFEIDGLFWNGSREEYERWVAYKRERATAFVRAGWSVSWYPDATNSMDVFSPPRPHSGLPGYAASVVFFGKPSRFGIEEGAISKLMIRCYEEPFYQFLHGGSTETIYNFDRGLDFDLLEEHPEGRKLYDAVLRELNTPD